MVSSFNPTTQKLVRVERTPLRHPEDVAKYRQRIINSAQEITDGIDTLMSLLDSTAIKNTLSGDPEDLGLDSAICPSFGLGSGSSCQIRPPSPHAGTKTGPASVYLPPELIYEIVSSIPDQKSLYCACLVSRAWYSAATPLLYAKPKLDTGNFAPFVAAVAPTIQAPTKKLKKQDSGADLDEYLLCDLVKELDLLNVGKIEHICSWVGRLLSHCRKSLLFFRAPMHGLGGTVTRLKYPENLTHLDLSNCVESIELTKLCPAIMNLSKLQVIKFPPTSSINVVGDDRKQRTRVEQVAHHPLSTFEYPPVLQQLFLSGSIGDSFLMSSRPIPESIYLLSLSHFPFARPDALRHVILRFAPQITTLHIYHPIPRLSHDFCDRILMMCPLVKQLGISVDYCTSHLFDEENTPAGHPLEELYMRASSNVWRRLKVTPDDISIALMEGRLRKLRVVKASKRLEWDRDQDKLEDLIQVLQMDRSTFDFDEEMESSTELNPEEDQELPLVDRVESGVWLI